MVVAGVKPCKVSVENNYKTLKYLVNPCLAFLADIEAVMLEKDVALIHNKEGALLGLKGNRQVGNAIIAGVFFIVGVKEGKIASLSKEKEEKYYKRFERIETYTDKEVSKAYWDLQYYELEKI